MTGAALTGGGGGGNLLHRRLSMPAYTTTREELLKRISVDLNVCFGTPCIRGHRIWVSLILDLLACGLTYKEILDDYPGLVEDDLRACIAYGAEMARERFIELSPAGR
jgi:uncharacterized protein (DUF433 family)